MKTKLIVNVVLLSGIIVITTQDIIGRKGCDCSICNDVDNKLNEAVGSKFNHDKEDKSSCSICEKKKEILRMERERQRKLQKCPFEILGASTIKGKSSQEVFDEFRELIIPSQNGFFDMMRGIVKTMHVSSEAELKWAKEKEAKQLAKKKEEELKKVKEGKPKKGEELINQQSPINPKVTVILKQTPCGQTLIPSDPVDSKKMPFVKRHPKETQEDISGIPQESNENMDKDQAAFNYKNVDSKENLLHSDLFEQLIGYNMWSTVPPEEATGRTETGAEILTLKEENGLMEGSTEFPFVKFVSDDELKTLWKSSRNPADVIDLDLNLLPGASLTGEELQEVNGNIQNADTP